MDVHKIIMFGPSGSGKTAFLASMWSVLSINRPDFGFRLDVIGSDGKPNHTLKNLLNKIYQMNVSSKPDFAPNTQFGNETYLEGEIPTLGELDILFECKINSFDLGTVYSTARFQYLDYSGEYTNSTDPNATESISEKMRDVHVLFGLIDGHKILQLLENDDWDWIYENLDSMLQKMIEHNRPIHFVLSKWDVLEDKYSLKDVVDKLMEYPNMRDFVVNCENMGRTVRIIPVSSFGKGFAEIKNGKMVKVGKHAKPFNVEVPLACVLPDLLEQAEEDLKNKAVDLTIKANAEFKPSTTTKLWGYLSGQLGLRSTLFEKAVTNLLIKPEIERYNQKIIEAKDNLKNVQNELTAFVFMFQTFKTLKYKLEKNFPDSTLTK